MCNPQKCFVSLLGELVPRTVQGVSTEVVVLVTTLVIQVARVVAQRISVELRTIFRVAWWLLVEEVEHSVNLWPLEEMLAIRLAKTGELVT